MAPTSVSFSQLSKAWKMAVGGGVALLATGGIVLVFSTANSSGAITRQEYSDGTSAQSGSLTVGSGALKNKLLNDGRVVFDDIAYRFPYSDGSATGQVLKTDGAGQLSWSADLNSGGGGASFGTGSLQTAFNKRYVSRQGDTMTGALALRSGNGTVSVEPGLQLEVVGTASGRVLRAQDALASSGTLSVRGAVTLTGLPSCASIQTSSAGALACNNALYLATSTGSLKTLFDANYLRTSTGSLRASLYAFGQGLSRTVGGLVTTSQAMSGTSLNIRGTMSGYGLTVMSGPPSYVLGQLGLGTTRATTAQLMLASSTKVSASMRLLSGSTVTTPNEGDIWNDSAKHTLMDYMGGIRQALVGTVYTNTADATNANSTGDNSILGSGTGTTNLPANFFVRGKTVRVTVRGYYSTTGTPTLTFRVKLGGNTVCGSSANTTSTVSGEYFEVSALLMVRSTGAGGSVACQSTATVSTSASAVSVWRMVNGGFPGLDTTVARNVDITAQWGTAAAGNTITGQEAVVEVLN